MIPIKGAGSIRNKWPRYIICCLVLNPGHSFFSPVSWTYRRHRLYLGWEVKPQPKERHEYEQILLAYHLAKETVAAITILYRNTKVKVRSPDGDTEYFDIVAGVLQVDALAPYLFIIYALRTSIDKIRENGFELTKKRGRMYLTKTITDADYADDIAILANTLNQAETLLHSLERATAGISFYVNAHKTEYMCFNQTGDVSTLDGTSLKLVDKFTYLVSSVSSTEKDIDTRLTQTWTAIDRLLIIWKSDLTDKWNAVSSRQRSCRYCCMDALLGR